MFIRLHDESRSLHQDLDSLACPFFHNFLLPPIFHATVVPKHITGHQLSRKVTSPSKRPSSQSLNTHILCSSAFKNPTQNF